MTDSSPDGRAVRLHTRGGVIEGRLHPGIMRTLDELNRGGKQFLAIGGPRTVDRSWPLEPGTLALNRDSVLLVVELEPATVVAGGKYGRFTRAPIQLLTAEFVIQGFVHVMPGGDAMKRLDHEHHPFVALTSAMVRGAEIEFTTPFVAVNRTHVIGAQTIGVPEPLGCSASDPAAV